MSGEISIELKDISITEYSTGADITFVDKDGNCLHVCCTGQFHYLMSQALKHPRQFPEVEIQINKQEVK